MHVKDVITQIFNYLEGVTYDMSKLIFDRGSFSDFTSVSNIFIDEYMPKANGEFIKIYILLLRLVNTGCEDLSISMIADTFNMLESDVVRGLKYWSDQNLLSLSMDSQGSINGVKLESLHTNRYVVRDFDNNNQVLATASGESIPASVPVASGVIVPSKKKYSAKEVSSFADNENFSQLTFLAQTYLGKTLTPSEINSILYLLDGLALPTEFIEYIMETCISSGHKSISYIEKQAVSYFEKGITTIKGAKEDSLMRKDICDRIYKIFGLAAKAPVKKETAYITKWTSDYGFSDDIILEACNRTMEHTHTASFPYADKILFGWSENNVHTLEDINKLDKEHTLDNQKKYAPKKAVNKVSKTSRPKNAKSFEGRDYNHSKIEEQILNSRNKKIQAILSEDK